LGEIFTVRVAGNVVAAHELGSIEYAVEHLGTNLIVVLGHERCGAVSTTYELHGASPAPELGPNLSSLINSIDPAVTAVLLAAGGKATDPNEQAAQIEECVIENAKRVAESLETVSTMAQLLLYQVSAGLLTTPDATPDLQ
jgi:carbonic anhydrase